MRLMRAVSPGLAFKMTVKNMGNMMRCVGPASITELSGNRAVVDISHCKLVDYPGGEESCVYGCQRVTPSFTAEQFGVDVKCNREGNRCTMTATTLK